MLNSFSSRQSSLDCLPPASGNVLKLRRREWLKASQGRVLAPPSSDPCEEIDLEVTPEVHLALDREKYCGLSPFYTATAHCDPNGHSQLSAIRRQIPDFHRN